METIYWAEQPLIDHPQLQQFNRVAVLSGFNFPDVGELNFFSFKILFKNKETGKIFKEVKAPIFTQPISDERNMNKILKNTLTEFLNSVKIDDFI